MKDLKLVNFYKNALKKGSNHGFELGDDRVLRPNNGRDTSAYVTYMHDTGDDEMSYNRLYLDGYTDSVKTEMVVAVTNMTIANVDGADVSLQQYLGNPEIAADKKLAVLKSLPHVEAINKNDIILHSLKGRYVWVYLSALPLEGDECEISGLRLEYPKYTFTDYLPEIYQGNDFFDRYFAVFQSVYLDLESKVDKVPGELDFETAPDENLKELAGWVGLEEISSLFTASQLRHMISNIDVYQGGKGTLRALSDILELICGIKPRIIEQFQWRIPGLARPHSELYSRLYGEGHNHYCIILDLTNAPSANLKNLDRDKLESLIDNYTPMGSQFKLVFLYGSSHIDTHCYLGVNSVISSPEDARVSEGMVLGNNIVVG